MFSTTTTTTSNIYYSFPIPCLNSLTVTSHTIHVLMLSSCNPFNQNSSSSSSFILKTSISWFDVLIWCFVFVFVLIWCLPKWNPSTHLWMQTIQDVNQALLMSLPTHSISKSSFTSPLTSRLCHLHLSTPLIYRQCHLQLSTGGYPIIHLSRCPNHLNLPRLTTSPHTLYTQKTAYHDGAEVIASGLEIGRSHVQISPKTNISIMIKLPVKLTRK